MKQHNNFRIALDLSLTDAIYENKHKFCFTNPTVSLEGVANSGKLFEEVHEQKGVVEDS